MQRVVYVDIIVLECSYCRWGTDTIGFSPGEDAHRSSFWKDAALCCSLLLSWPDSNHCSQSLVQRCVRCAEGMFVDFLLNC